MAALRKSNGNLTGEEPKEDRLEEYKEKLQQEDEMLRDKLGRFKEGNSFSKGREEGSENYASIRKRALKYLAREQGLDEDEMEMLLVADQLKLALISSDRTQLEALKDAADRKYGKATNNVDMTVDTNDDYLSALHRINALHEQVRREQMEDSE